MRNFIACLLSLFVWVTLARAETLNWNYPAGNVNVLAGSSTTTVNTVSITSSGVATGSFAANSLQIMPTTSSNGSSTGIVNMTMDANTDNSSAFQTFTVRFSEPVYNVSFTVLDIDGGPSYAGLWNDVVDFSSDNGFPSATITNASWVAYNAATGRATAISNQNAVSGSANQAYGNIRLTFVGPITTFSVRHYSAAVDDPGTGANETNAAGQVIFIDDVTFTRSPRLAIQKTSNGGVGTFNFSNSNGFTFSAPTTYAYGVTTTSVTTAVAGTPVTGSSNILGYTNVATTITETGPAGWLITSSPVVCTDSNSATSGNPASFNATVSGAAVTLAATNVRPGAVITCSIVNGKRPTLQIVKQSVGNTGSFDFISSNFSGTVSVNTGTANPQSSAVQTLTTASVATTVTETVPAGWTLASATCTGMGAGGTATLVGNVLTLNAAATAATANIVCTFTNNKTPIVRVQKITTGGFGGTFTFTSGNLATTPSGITTTLANTATPSSPAPINYVSVTGNNVTLAESISLAWISSGVTCSDGNAAVTGNPTPVATSTTANVTISGARVVNGADITCVFTNAAAAPQLTVSKSASPASVTAAGQTVTYTITVQNSGNVALTSIAISDPLGSVTCSSSGTNVIASLAPAASQNCSLTYVATQSDFDTNGGGDGDIDNTASAASTYNGNAVSGNGSAAVGLMLNPAFVIEKSASPMVNVAAGSTVTYNYRVRNTGNTTVTGVTVADAHNGYGTSPVPGNEVMLNDAAPLSDSTDSGANGVWDSLRPGDEIVFTASYIVKQKDIDLHQ